MVVRNGRLRQVYNVDRHNERTTLQSVKNVISYLHDNVNEEITENLMRHVEDRKGHDRRCGITADKIKEELGWYHETTFEVAIERTIKL